MIEQVKRYGLFSFQGSIDPALRARLSVYRYFSFPRNYFSGIDRSGKVLAVSTDYLLGKAPTKIIFARMKLLGKLADFAIAVPEGNVRSLVIEEFEGHRNLIIKTKLIGLPSAGQCHRPAPKPKPEILKPVVSDRRPPDYTYTSEEIPIVRAGYLTSEEKEYIRWMTGNISLTWKSAKISLPGIDSHFLIETAIETLVRSNSAALDRFTAWGLICPEDAEAIIANRSRKVSTERIARMLIWLTSEHLSAGNLTAAQTKVAVSKLIPHYYLEYLVNTFKEDGVTHYDAWYFSIHFRKPENGIRQALDRAKTLFSIHGKKWCQRSFIWRIASYYGHKSESFLLRVFSNAQKMVDKFGKQGLTYSSAVYYALHNPRNTERKMSKVIKEAEQLSQDRGITIAYALHLLRYKGKKLKKIDDQPLE